jgi:hypothetical protein
MFDLSTFVGIAVDAKGNLYVTGLSACGPVIGAFAPPYTSLVRVTNTGFCSFETTFGAVAVSSTQLFSVHLGPSFQPQESVDISQLPFPGGSGVATIKVGPAPAALAVDSAGNLYVADGNDNTIRVFAPGFTNSSVPAVTLTVSGVSRVAVGK